MISCKKEDFEENGPAMTPDLLLDEALIKKEGLVSELLLQNRCFANNQKLDDKSLLSSILTTEANLISGKTTGSDSCSLNNSSNNSNNSASSNNSSISHEKVQLVDSVLPEIPASTVKRRPLLVACKKSTPKKSPPNSYKNLIKRTNLDDENTITVLSDDEYEEEDEEEAVPRKPKHRPTLKPKKVLKRTRRIFGAEQLRHFQKLLKTKRIRRPSKRPSCIPRNPEVPAQAVTTIFTKPVEVISSEIVGDTAAVPEKTKDESVSHIEEKSDSCSAIGTMTPPTEQQRPMSNIDLTIDLVAKGYFSEPEIVSPEAKTKSRLLKKVKLQEGRSQSEQNRGKSDRSSDAKILSKKAKKIHTLNDDFDKRKNKCKPAVKECFEPDVKEPSPISIVLSVTPQEMKKSSKCKEIECKDKKSGIEPKHICRKRPCSKVSKISAKKRATSTPLPSAEKQEEQHNNLEVSAIEPESVIDDRETDFDDATTMLVDDDMMSVDTNTMINRHNNNNNSSVENKNTVPDGEPLEEDPLMVDQNSLERLPTGERPVALLGDEDLEDIMLSKRSTKKGVSTLKRTSRSRSKSKSKKFSTKKRHRPTRIAEVEEIIIPRKYTSAPRWSNGWTWEGQPFQGKVFLNSDDLPVPRTCYPAMRHSEGDIIRPRDCVLLRAGSKRAELPYVAKVAHLWENPEDGEMMMSLLWYYRPEHTEQGRQSTDGPDEVFASRHKDHNSVACIEDKCYVLTFAEYCRFRRQLKGLEENIEEQPSIVPPLRRENPRLPPPIVSPELVMYCQRVYEFRLKRLLKTPS